VFSHRLIHCFSKRVFQHVQVLLMGAILAPGKRTVSSALKAMSLDQHKRFHRYHRVLSRAVWSSGEASRVLLELLVETFVPEGPLVVGVEETLERRRGKKISAKGIYRDPVRSSHGHFVKASALRWICLTLLAPVPWASRVWTLPFLSTLAYSERYAKECGKRHKSLSEWAWQMEATFQEVRQRLGFETQRHWSDMAVRRTAPALLGVFSLVTLFAHQYMANNNSANPVRGAAWYEKQHPTFCDALALVRKELWAREATFCGSLAQTDAVKVPRALMERLKDAVCYAA
jgi:hypothetical protein